MDPINQLYGGMNNYLSDILRIAIDLGWMVYKELKTIKYLTFDWEMKWFGVRYLNKKV